ncbi:GNAT family N-acetyltransferase [Erysipelothrix rhusiopathiae]|uniref:GNAT family N-acetyltransferase n=1 Tax=Erysipelothrix rhusiopathiae TaxID=1648 RepID=UPI000F435288|nr:GNAT family N-acetyltransferase [Erysipelothrix rhusiopathiae]AYV33944.1 GNAT family N-acetyltransferase [Erysipelothrix rhusiopathiae]MDE8052043.1 GNAT family N-acetyltransferase [Erysipelothrix rhusiopathiae]MDE8081546.1 GNAT family N-acetyltransferase [Erysipelothrix rhusiopathiae]MDE8126730.1 GNAT family N-acetyltransferase [Erysipelothrix rhusiopathiae]MDE8130072.1 GNAT family N-acetyltransferase [Erysipelothrix rhusiopathiae]
MIRYMEIPEIDQVMEIWLKCNLEVHSFVDASFWNDNYDSVKEMMENANIYVSVEDGVIQGFAGVTEGYYLAGIFVSKDSRNKGIGKQLLDYIKARYDELTLDVYDQNIKAQSFYKREGFVVVETHNDGPTEHTMVWPETL